MEGRNAGQKEWEELGFTDDFIFGKVMSDPELCREVVETVLCEPVERIEYVEAQEPFGIAPDARGVRLDVYAADGKGTVYNVEMQTADKGDLPRRSRYYQGMIDLGLLGRGASYGSLAGSYVIFLCTFDPFGRGCWKYTFTEMCAEEQGLALGDGTAKVFVNAHGCREGLDGGTAAFLDYIADGTAAAGTLAGRLAGAVAEARHTKAWRKEYMKLKIILDEKKEEGRSDEREKIVTRLLLSGMDAGRIAEILGLDPGYVVDLEARLRQGD